MLLCVRSEAHTKYELSKDMDINEGLMTCPMCIVSLTCLGHA